MDKADIPFLSASQLSDLIKKREVSSVEAVEAYLDRIDSLNDKLFAYLTVCRDEALQAAQRLVATQPSYFIGYAYIAMNAVALGQLDEARAAIAEGRRIRSDLSLDLVQGYFGVSRPAVDAQRNAALRQAGLE